ncbi:MAG: hypothetical protein MPW15_15535 [Candidatus Manganitrophus sp.]|nr:hypothetical protein [Candidatus Manganitrophus sp.]
MEAIFLHRGSIDPARIGHFLPFFVRVSSRQIHIAGITPHPNKSWISQVARNVTVEEFGFLKSRGFLMIGSQILLLLSADHRIGWDPKNRSACSESESKRIC